MALSIRLQKSWKTFPNKFLKTIKLGHKRYFCDEKYSQSFKERVPQYINRVLIKNSKLRVFLDLDATIFITFKNENVGGYESFKNSNQMIFTKYFYFVLWAFTFFF